MRILIGIDGSPQAERALRWGLHEAQLHDATVTVVHAFDVHERSHALEPGASADEHHAAADDLVARAVARSAGHGAVEVAVQTVAVIDDSAAHVLLTRARDSDLVVVGSRGLGGFRGLLLGSVSQQVSAHAPVPVAVIPSGRGDDDAGDPQAVREIVVGVDGSPDAERALCWALDEARVRHCALTVLYVYPPAAATLTSDVVAGLGQVLRHSFYAHSQAVAERVLAEAVARVAPRGADVQVEQRAVEGAAGQVLVDEAADPSTMLVLGSRGRGGFAGLLLGSVSQQCLHHARGPVVVVHRHPPR